MATPDLKPSLAPKNPLRLVCVGDTHGFHRKLTEGRYQGMFYGFLGTSLLAFLVAIVFHHR